MAAPAASDPREELWKAAFDTYYDSFFEELMADALIGFWSSVDVFTRILVAVTASGSAISGWVLWNQPGYRNVWLALSGIAAFLSILHTVLGIPARIKAHAENKRRFASLRTDLETFRYRMRVDQEFDIGKFTKEFLDFRKRYSENIQLLSNDLARIRRYEFRVQNRVDERLRNEIVSE